MKSPASLRLSKDSSSFRSECQIQVLCFMFFVVVAVWFFVFV